MLLTPFAADAQDELTQKFVTSYKENYGETPIQFAADAYDAIYAIKAAMERSGNITTQGRERNKRIAEATILLT